MLLGGLIGGKNTASTAYVSATSIAFGGTDEYASRADAAAHEFTTTASWSLWVKGAATADYAGVVSKGHYSGTPDLSYTIKRSGAAAGKIGVLISDDGANYRDVSSSITVFDDTWHHVCVTFSSGTLKIYVDGVDDGSITTHISATVNSLKNSADGLRFGSQLDNATPANFYVGRLNNVSLWNIALSLAQVGELRSSSKPADLTLHSAYANCVSWYKCGDGDTIGASGIVDTKGSLHLSPTNMEAGDIVSDAP
jgi:hypothetical protein